MKHALIVAGGDSNVTYVYKTTSNTWRQAASLSKRHGTAATLWNGKMFIAGGSSGNKELDLVEQYDPETNLWTALPNMLSSRLWLSLICFENTLFAIGGLKDTKDLDSVERYDLNTKQWENVASLNVKRHTQCGVTLPIGLLVVGGRDQTEVIKSCELLNGASQTWKYVASLVNARCAAQAAELNDKVYVFGGRDECWQYLNSVEEYDWVADKWTAVLSVRLSVPRGYFASATVDGRTYLCGGYNDSGDSNVVETFNASKLDISCVAPLPEALNGLAAASVPVLGKLYELLFEEDD